MEASVDTTVLMQKAQAMSNDLTKMMPDIVKAATSSFASAAAINTGPDPGSRTIPARLYRRPVISLKALMKGKEKHGLTPTEIDIVQFKNGMRYKVLNTKGKSIKSNVAYAYCKTAEQAKALSFISTRGLARVSWGTDLPSIGVRIPNAIQRLMSKAEKLNSLNFNEVILKNQDDICFTEVANKSEGISHNTVDRAKKWGLDAAEKTIFFQLKAATKKITENWNNT